MKYLRIVKFLVQAGYAKVWQTFGPRPWTYEIRKWSERHEYPALVIVTGVTAALIIGQIELVIAFGRYALPFVLWADFMAFVAGHLFWDTRGKYIPK